MYTTCTYTCTCMHIHVRTCTCLYMHVYACTHVKESRKSITFQFSLTESKSADSFGSCFRMSSPIKMFYKEEYTPHPLMKYVAIILWQLYLQVHPLSLDLQDHLYDLQNVRESSLPHVHLLVEGFDIPRSLHGRQSHLVILQQLKQLLRGSALVISIMHYSHFFSVLQ